MQRFYQLLFLISLAFISWLAMMGVHELGHVLGGLLTGGSVSQVVLHPFSISRTDLSYNPHPTIVVWAGPVLGVLFPLALLMIAHKFHSLQTRLVQFFAGFCLIANGAYIAGGSWGRIGDCGVMLQTGTPIWMMWSFGFLTMPAGFLLWHRLGSLQDLIRKPESISPWAAWTALLILIAMVVLMELFSVR